MKTQFRERKRKSVMAVSKKLFVLTTVAAASLIATKSYSQVVIGAHIGFRVPVPRVYVGGAIPAPASVYAPAPAPAPAPVYDGGYYADAAVCEADFPGYAYYDYPAWYGHYHDRVYFEHYRPIFYRDHAAYFYHGGFDHARWEHDRGFANHAGYGYHGGYVNHGNHGAYSDHGGHGYHGSR